MSQKHAGVKQENIFGNILCLETERNCHFSNTSGEKEESLFQILLWKLENAIFKLFPTIP